MAKKTKYLGLESGRSSKTWFTPNPQPHTGNGETGGILRKAIKVVFRDEAGKKK